MVNGDSDPTLTEMYRKELKGLSDGEDSLNPYDPGAEMPQ